MLEYLGINNELLEVWATLYSEISPGDLLFTAPHSSPRQSDSEGGFMGGEWQPTEAMELSGEGIS